MAVKRTIDLADDMNVAGPHLAIWTRNQATNPAAVKPITGRQYQGSSPNPTYLIAKATAEFGPVGQGFGWNVLAEHWRDYAGGTTLHTCRIAFWWKAGKETCTFEEYGETKIAYVTGAGKQLVDDDGPKKSLTDAIVKALSRLGFGGDIFLGRWDDQKYVDELTGQYTADAPYTPGPPPAPRGAAAARPPSREAPAPRDAAPTGPGW